MFGNECGNPTYDRVSDFRQSFRQSLLVLCPTGTFIEVTVNPHANAFYLHVGFVRGDDSETRLGGAPRMHLKLHGDGADYGDTGFDPR